MYRARYATTQEGTSARGAFGDRCYGSDCRALGHCRPTSGMAGMTTEEDKARGGGGGGARRWARPARCFALFPPEDSTDCLSSAVQRHRSSACLACAQQHAWTTGSLRIQQHSILREVDHSTCTCEASLAAPLGRGLRLVMSRLGGGNLLP